VQEELKSEQYQRDQRTFFRHRSGARSDWERAVTVASIHFLDALKAAADEAEKAEGQFRREIAQRIALLERERAFAFRRLNLMQAVTKAVTGAESEEAAVACALDALCDKLGWQAASPARDAVLTQFTPVVQSVFHDLTQPAESEPAESAGTTSADSTSPPVQDALAAFETWYAGGHQAPFWALFEHYIPETPRVDF
jgi:hypothetical protein